MPLYGLGEVLAILPHLVDARFIGPSAPLVEEKLPRLDEGRSSTMSPLFTWLSAQGSLGFGFGSRHYWPDEVFPPPVVRLGR